MSAASRPAPWCPTVMLADEDRKPVTELEELREVNKAIRRQLVDQENTIRQLRQEIWKLKAEFAMATEGR